jgi:hypothetical protein
MLLNQLMFFPSFILYPSHPMKKLISLSICCSLLLAACTSRDTAGRVASGEFCPEADTVEYPLLIDNGTKLVYQFGRMTADKGLKLYYDTIPYTAKSARPVDLPGHAK